MSSYRIKNEIAVIKMALEAIELINDESDRLQDINDKIKQLEKENAMMREALDFYGIGKLEHDKEYQSSGFYEYIYGKRAREVLAKLTKGGVSE